MKRKGVVIALLLLIVAAAVALIIAQPWRQKDVSQPTASPAPIETATPEPEATPETSSAPDTASDPSAVPEGELSDGSVTLSGFIAELFEDGSFLLRCTDGLETQVLLNESTVNERGEALAVGQFVLVDYNGIMTRSLPGQINALRIYGATLDGVVTAISERDVTLNTQTHGDVIVHIPEDIDLPTLEEHILVHFNGAMTLSLPPQISALAIETVPSENAR